MRSMGIGVNVIRIGMYVRMLISLIPAFIILIGTEGHIAENIFAKPLTIDRVFGIMFGACHVLVVSNIIFG